MSNSDNCHSRMLAHMTSNAALTWTPSDATLRRSVRVSWWYTATALAACHLGVAALNAIAATRINHVAAVVFVCIWLAFSLPPVCGFQHGLNTQRLSRWQGWSLALSILAAAACWVVAQTADPLLQIGSLPLVVSLSQLACILKLPAGYAVLTGAFAIPALSALSKPTTLHSITLLGLLLPLMYWVSAWAWNVVLRLDRAREVEAELAVAHERLRFAADLHDAQGHTLQVLALKTELASRLVSTDPATAAEHLRDARALAAGALEQTRSIALSYRNSSLPSEISSAKDILSAAGITANIAVSDVPTGQDFLFTTLIRECVTNVLRHAQDATVVELVSQTSENEWHIHWMNDGATPNRAATPGGSGLEMLRQRFVDAGGNLMTHTVPDHHFNLTGVLPR